MDKPKTPKGKKTKQTILDESIRLINARGFDIVTLNDICEAAGIAIGTFYHYFKSTQEILYEILRREGEEMLQYYRGLSEPSCRKTLGKILEYQLEYFERKGKEIVARIYSMELLSRHGTSLLKTILPLDRIVRELVARGQSLGEIAADLDPERCSHLLLSLVLSYSFSWISSEETGSLRDLAHDHLAAEIERMRPPAVSGLS